MNLIVAVLIAISGLSGFHEVIRGHQGTDRKVSWVDRSPMADLIHVQAGEAEKNPVPVNKQVPKERPLGDDSQNWGAMIVFAVGIALFIGAYIVFRRTPVPKKKRKVKF